MLRDRITMTVEEGENRLYEPPRLVEYGAVEELTHGEGRSD